MSSFEAAIEEAPRGGAFVEVPPDVVEELGGGGRIPVLAEFDGIPYRGSVVRMGGASVIGVLKDIRETLGKGAGDAVTVELRPDSEERVVDLPVELADALASNPAAKAAFEALSYTHRREHAQHVAEAKRPETRQRRAIKTVESLSG